MKTFRIYWDEETRNLSLPDLIEADRYETKELNGGVITEFFRGYDLHATLMNRVPEAIVTEFYGSET